MAIQSPCREFGEGVSADPGLTKEYIALIQAGVTWQVAAVGRVSNLLEELQDQAVGGRRLIRLFPDDNHPPAHGLSGGCDKMLWPAGAKGLLIIWIHADIIMAGRSGKEITGYGLAGWQQRAIKSTWTRWEPRPRYMINDTRP